MTASIGRTALSRPACCPCAGYIVVSRRERDGAERRYIVVSNAVAFANGSFMERNFVLSIASIASLATFSRSPSRCGSVYISFYFLIDPFQLDTRSLAWQAMVEEYTRQFSVSINRSMMKLPVCSTKQEFSPSSFTEIG